MQDCPRRILLASRVYVTRFHVLRHRGWSIFHRRATNLVRYPGPAMPWLGKLIYKDTLLSLIRMHPQHRVFPSIKSQLEISTSFIWKNLLNLDHNPPTNPSVLSNGIKKPWDDSYLTTDNYNLATVAVVVALHLAENARSEMESMAKVFKSRWNRTSPLVNLT